MARLDKPLLAAGMPLSVNRSRKIKNKKVKKKGVPHLGGLPGQPCRVTRLVGVSFLLVYAEGEVG